MELRDFIVTPIVILLVFGIAFLVRSFFTDDVTRRYFIPGLSLRIFGALMVGFIYQFYYNGGDTLAYHTHGSRIIWEAFMDEPVKGLQLLTADGNHHPSTFEYSSKIWYFKDQQSYAVIRFTTILDLLTFSSYSATAVLFAVISFVGSWLLFQTFYPAYSGSHRGLAISCFFIPSVFFWGSGIFKDTLTLTALSVATFYLHSFFIRGRISWVAILAIVISFWVIYSIKIYILLCFLPAAIIWIFSSRLSHIKSTVIRILLIPFVIVVVGLLGYYAVQKVAEDNPKYNLSRIAETARITAYDIRYWTGKDAGSGYSLGELDGSIESLIRHAPQAVVVSLFRPYLWEVENPLMTLSALEGLILLIFTVSIVILSGLRILKYFGRPDILFCLVFSIMFAFAVGVSTFNFGTLSRYKIPALPYYGLALTLIYSCSRSYRRVLTYDFDSSLK